jgi:hypothetical protein
MGYYFPENSKEKHMTDDLRNWRERRSIIRDGVDIRELVQERILSPEAEALLFPPEPSKPEHPDDQ